MAQLNPLHKSSTPGPEQNARKQPVSERKILANRKNAIRSTGPKTERGKRAVSRNAITHGIVAREVVITAGDGEESQEEFDALAEGLRQHYNPVGPIERMLVEKIAVSWWRLGRINRAENGEIRKRLDTLSMDHALRISAQTNLALIFSMGGGSLFSYANPADAKVSTVDRHSAVQAVDGHLTKDRTGLMFLTQHLELAKSEIASDGYMSEGIRKRIFGVFFSLDMPFALLCLNAGPPVAEKEAQPSKRNSDKRDDTAIDRSLVLGSIDAKIKQLSALEEYTSEREKLALDAEGRSFYLPSAEVSDKLLRYEAHLDRQLYRAMDQLERLQRQRQGENVPLPLSVNVSRST
jgi:hypothetical protein